MDWFQPKCWDWGIQEQAQVPWRGLPPHHAESLWYIIELILIVFLAQTGGMPGGMPGAGGFPGGFPGAEGGFPGP